MKKLFSMLLLSSFSMTAIANWGAYPASPITTTDNALTHMGTDFATTDRTPANEPASSYYKQPNLYSPDAVNPNIAPTNRGNVNANFPIESASPVMPLQ